MNKDTQDKGTPAALQVFLLPQYNRYSAEMTRHVPLLCNLFSMSRYVLRHLTAQIILERMSAACVCLRRRRQSEFTDPTEEIGE
ncbi:hypothetical protein TPCCA_0904 [Treponema paraluiscuniculi Cuniculi A]|uniref:Uncharacterized protein n=2 Tax=Treponema paraluiscuniculi TaxID=53435 RepID=F7XQY7_TREPU|nr:hypothetical protein [Treponema paraluiscuniculi]AEH40828.1 hypothetical protein TPCCA_0904 [Treponema paraluiscuniculi Cuniculi A]WKC72757.1 hypothetical protein TPLL2_0904 [Treponema paraluiscuniculi]